MAARKAPAGGPIAAAHARARKDKSAAVIAAAARSGIRFRLAGEELVVRGAAGLDPADRALLERLAPDIRERLVEPNPESDLVDRLGVGVVLVDDPDEARAVVAALPTSVGLDIETEAADGGAEGRFVAVTLTGKRATHQPKPIDGGAALDPYRGRPRTLQVYDPQAEVAYVVDLHHAPLDSLDGLWSRKLVAHNAVFECAMLRGRPRDVVDSLQLAGLVYGCEGGKRSLEAVAKIALGVELPKSLQTSDWSAPVLSGAQIEYAAVDAVVAHRAARAMWRGLGAEERRAFRAQNAVVPLAAAMRLAGVPFDPAIHRETIRTWEEEHARAREAFAALTGEDPPPPGPRRSDWLEARMPAEELSWWPRTAQGRVSTAADLMGRLGAVPEIRPLLAILDAEKMLSSFGRPLLECVNPTTGRIHPDWKPCFTKAGRWSCGKPNAQQLPPDARRAVIAPPGRVLVAADYGQIELRVMAEITGERVMREAFAEGLDLHRLTASAVAGVEPESVTPAQRQAAKALNFGLAFGMGSKALAAYAFSSYRVEMTEAEADAARRAWFARYPAVQRWQRTNFDCAKATGLLRTALGRPLRAEWEHGGQLKYTVCCNFPVQGSAADVMLTAIPRVAAGLTGFDATLILQVHDELVVECAEAEADAVAAALAERMTSAFTELFPDAPTRGLVDVHTARCWADAK